MDTDGVLCEVWIASIQYEPTGSTIWFQFISIINLYMFRKGLLLIIRRYILCIYSYSNWYISCIYFDWLLTGFSQQPVNINARHIPIAAYTGCNRRNVRDFGRVFLRSNYNDITQNTYIQSWTVTEVMAGEVWNFDSCYSLIDYQIHIETGRNMWFL